MTRKRTKKIICHCGLEIYARDTEHKNTEEHKQRLLNIEVDKRKFFKRRRKHNEEEVIETSIIKSSSLTLDILE